MKIDAATGLVTWTPDSSELGSNVVTVGAELTTSRSYETAALVLVPSDTVTDSVRVPSAALSPVENCTPSRTACICACVRPADAIVSTPVDATVLLTSSSVRAVPSSGKMRLPPPSRIECTGPTSEQRPGSGTG